MAFGRKDFGLPRFLFLFAILIWQVNAQVNLETDLRPPEAQEPEAAEACDPTDAELRKRISIKRHAAAVVAGFADGAMAQLPMATAVVPMIQAAMVFAIAQEYGCYLDLGTAVAVVTMLSSDYVKMSLVSHAVGWIPFAGNMVKMGLSVVMTEGIGLAAENLLGCPTSRQNLLEQAAREEQNENLSDEKKAGVFREHFHAIADFLSNTTLSDTSEAAREAWRRVESLFRQEDQVALLGKVHEARSPQELLSLVQTYKWNLKVVEASLEALRDRYPVRRLACTDIDVVATKLWASKAADGEVKAVVGPHLLHCWHLLSKDLQEDAAQVAQELAIEATRLGAGKGSAAVLPGSLALLLVALQKGGVGNFTPRLPLLDGLMKATQKEVDACHVLREVFRREAFAELVGSWVQVRHVQQLDQMEAPQGAEMCLPGLLADIKQRLTLPTLPPGVELPSVTEVSPKAFNHAFAGLVGQNCAVKRLVQSPGNVRLRKKGIQRPGVPLVLLMTGPSGTGKTMAARKIAEYIHGRPIQELLATGRFKLFPMNQFRMEEDLKTFFGPPRGIQGSGDLPDLVRANPDAVIVLDEIEKAHRSFAKALLTVFGEYGTVYDPRSGRDYSASNITFVLTSNLAKDAVLKHPVAVAKRLGRSLENNQPLPKGIDADPECMAYAELREMVEEEISKSQDNFFFRESEIRGRLTDTLPFLPFGPYEVQEAVRSFLTSEAQVFAESRHFANLELAWTEDVVVFFANLYVRKPDEGLRAVNKQLQSQVRDLLERAVDVGLVQPSATVVLRMVTPTGGATAMDLRVVPKEPQAPKLQSSSIEAEPVDTPKIAAEQDVPMFFPSLATAFANLGSTFETPRESSVSSGEWEWQADWEWQSDLEWLHNWDWQQLWEHVLLFLYKWRFPLAVTGLCLFAVMTAGAATPVAAPMAAAAAVPAAAPTITAGTTAMAVVSWAMALVQVAGGSASVAVPAMTFFWAWKNKVYIEAAIFAAISLALVPWALRIYRTTYSLLYSTTGFTSWKSSKKTRHRALKTKAQVPRTPQRVLQTRELPGPNPETPEKNPDEDFMELSPMEVTPAEPSRPHTPSSVSGDGAREASASPRSSERAQGMDEDEPLAIEQ